MTKFGQARKRALFHEGCAPVGAVKVTDQDDARNTCSKCGRTTYAVKWEVETI